MATYFCEYCKVPQFDVLCLFRSRFFKRFKMLLLKMAASLLQCLLNISSSITTVYKRFSNVTLLKNVKKIFAECKMRVTKSDSVMSDEKVE